MDSASQIVAIVLALAGAVTAGVSLWVQRRNAAESASAQRAAQSASASIDSARVDLERQSAAHTELVDALAAQGRIIDRYQTQLDAQDRQISALAEKEAQCRQAVTQLTNEVRIALARIAELGG